MLLLCSKPDTVSVVFPGPAAVTTPARLTRTTLWSFEAHCKHQRVHRPVVLRRDDDVQRVDLTRRQRQRRCSRTVTRRLHHHRRRGRETPTAVAWIVPWPAASATTLPFWSTLATSVRSEFQVRRPALPVSRPRAARAGTHGVFGREQVDGARLEPQSGRGAAAGRLAARHPALRHRRRRHGRGRSRRAGAAGDLHGGLPFARSYACFDDGDAVPTPVTVPLLSTLATRGCWTTR